MCSIPGLPSPGSNVTVIITGVNVNPRCVLVEFWGNFVQDQKLVYQQMKKEIQHPGDAFHEGEGKPGDLCLVRVHETWYRARIVSRNSAHYNVFLIDEGKTLQAGTSSLAWGQTHFFNLSPEVEFCILSNVLPLSVENRWSKLALEFMKSFCGKTVLARVLDFAIPQRAFLIDIPCLSRQMLEMGFAKNLSNEEFKAFVLRYLQCDVGSIEPLRTASIGFESIKTACYMYPELQAETTETVLVTEVNNPLRVFCQLKVFSQELKKLTEQITQHYERSIGSSFARPENLGASCASKGADGKWYRSVLQQVIPINNVVEVLHVDYGKKQLVPLDYVRPLAPDFFRMPVVTYVCSLHGVIDQGIGWTVSQIDHLKSLLLYKTLIAKFEYHSLSEGVYYITLYGEENTNINKLFASKENCSIDSMCFKDFTFHKTGNVRGDYQKSQVSVKGQTQKTEYLKGIFTDGLSPNSEHVVVVQHVDSPSNFWIQTQKYAAEFDMIMNGLTKLYSDQTEVSGLMREPEAGLLCVAKAKDGVFYRAAVCDVSETRAEVFFIDYGNKEWVECSNIRELPLRFQNIPALAIKCALYGIQPKNKEWDVNATLFFAKAVLDKVLNVHVVAKSQDTHLVKVIDSLSCGESDFSKLLCSMGFAEIKAIDEPVVSYNNVEQISDIFKTCAASQSSRSTFTEYFFPIGSSFDVTVCHIESPNDFWCQKVNDAKCLNLLMQNLQRYYANSEFQPLLEAACVARHPENGMWVRALVIQKLQASSVTVLLVDFGETKRVPIHNLRRIDTAFLQLKGQAFRCCLYNPSSSVSYSASVWSPKATMHFREFVDQAVSMNISLKCTVYAVMCDSQKVMFNVVDLESPFQSICKLLVQRCSSEHASKTVTLPQLRLDTYFYSSHGIKTGSEEDVYITCVKNINQFFCQLQRNSLQIDKLSDKVNNLCRQLQSINCSQTSEKICFAKYTDGLWYRGQLKSTKPSVVVHFVDYGYTQQVEKSDLLPVPDKAAEIMAMSVQAIECGLSDVPEKVPSELKIWFKSFVTNRQLKALIVAKEPSGKLIVQLYDGKTPVNAIIREKFHIEFERGEQITVEEADVKEQHRSYVMAEIQKVPQWTFEKPWRPQKGADPHQKYLRKHDGEMKKGSTRMLKHSAKPSIPKQTELPVKVVKPGLEAEVFISHCNSPFSFFVQLVTDESDICTLVEKLNEDQSNHIPVNPVDLHEGDLVCAVYPDDNCWYRAVLRKALVTGTADVEFIDFGNTAEVSVSKICILDEMFFQPRYSIHCSLTGEVNFNGDVVSNFKTEIEKNADRFLCKFIQQSDSVWEVKLEGSGRLMENSLFTGLDCITVTSVARSPDADLPLCTYKNPDLLTGQMIAVYASVIIGPQFFWCQYAEAKKLQEISDVIQKNNSHLESPCFNVEILPVGSGCIAVFDEDQISYRAQVTSGEEDTLSVVFVDYGNESKVKMCDVRPLPPELSDIPPQAFACQLDGFNVLEGSWGDKAAEQLFELINDRLLKVTILKLSGSSYMLTPHSVKVECEEIIINDAMKECWIQNSMTTSTELENSPSATYLYSNVTHSLCITTPEDHLSADSKEMHVALCRYSLKLQEECNGSLTKHEKQDEYTNLLQDNHKLTLENIKTLPNYAKEVGLKNINVNISISDIHQHTQPADVEKCSTISSTAAFTSFLEHNNVNQLEAVKAASPGGQSNDQVCENRAISEHKESETESDHKIIKSETLQENSHQYSGLDLNEPQEMSQTSVAKEQNEHVNKMCELIDELMDFLPITPLEKFQDKEPDSCLSDVVAEPNPKQDKEISITADVAQELCCAVKVQVQTVEDAGKGSPTIEKKEDEYQTKVFEQVDDLMNCIPAAPLQKLDENLLETQLVTHMVSSGELFHFTVNHQLYNCMLRVHVLVIICTVFMCSKDLQKSSDAEEPTASMVTHLTLRIENTSDDDIIYVKEWQGSLENESHSSE
ncbi:Tudor domain-containing protein 6 [Bagarius yarrelli]|uniref:Tudor domain-containing protein 6 n=1 Tax=Bagarius yarrelli TaxID=175774 RepID=A0A556U6S6_BAGYA|nr:Tudor domain-containing protein 6 [Bagarius yarrelli]